MHPQNHHQFQHLQTIVRPNHQHVQQHAVANAVRPSPVKPFLNWIINHFNTQHPLPQKQTEATTAFPVKQTTTSSPFNSKLFSRWKQSWWAKHVATCGKQTIRPYNTRYRIIGGREARKGSWPWMVSLFFELFNQQTCAGNLIDRQWIVTSAHCFSGIFNNTDFFRVRLGIHNNSGFSEEKSEQEFRISQVIRHPGYNDINPVYRFDNDIALVKLDRQVIYTDFVSPVCLTLDRLFDGEECIISGWGRIKRPSPTATENKIDPSAWPGVLQQTTVPIIDWNKCSRLEAYMDKLTQNMMCAGYRDGQKDTCQGDSGGPLQCQKNNQWFLAGITSWGGKSYNTCAEPLQPGVYTNVANYDTWILMEMFKSASNYS
ncbi:hypothetical protein KUTeg_003161 [Tegillarca granosa]|uniref:Peptidase S1 domain-containing protein n=1 Tax=Tegillarca granosa TaxID=220873 RepID=A0ABQ9FP87_TEGGR|nr:hypothetical protein KUTeg_003161 [Tegillarca granosa]